jgi:hypothetical protein
MPTELLERLVPFQVAATASERRSRGKKNAEQGPNDGKAAGQESCADLPPSRRPSWNCGVLVRRTSTRISARAFSARRITLARGLLSWAGAALSGRRSHREKTAMQTVEFRDVEVLEETVDGLLCRIGQKEVIEVPPRAAGP